MRPPHWLYFLRHAESFDVSYVPVELDEPVFQRAVKELERLTQDEIERERYESRQMAIRDQLSLEKEYRNARAEGVNQGQCIGLIHVAQRILKRPQSPTEELLNMPLDELQSHGEGGGERIARAHCRWQVVATYYR